MYCLFSDFLLSFFYPALNADELIIFEIYDASTQMEQICVDSLVTIENMKYLLVLNIITDCC